jgi:hypothetical protein
MRALSVWLLVSALGCNASDGSSEPDDGAGGGDGTGGSNSGGSLKTGGTSNAGGRRDAGTGGSTAMGGATGAGGSSGTAGRSASGGASAAGGAVGSGGASGSGGDAGTGGTTGPGVGPCDIYQSANTPCVAAHSTVRALYASYTGKLYQVKRASDSTALDITATASGGFANTSAQDTFCKQTTCTIPVIYDQSPQHNDLSVAPKLTFLENGGKAANATDGKISVGGHTVYGIYVTGNPDFVANRGVQTVAYRNNSAKGLATGNGAEAMYAVVGGKRFSAPCCFDYGNAETTGNDDGNGTMEAIYWGSDTYWATGGGNGPWVAADLENGMYKGDSKNTPSNTSITGWSWVTTMLKGPAENHFTLKAGNAEAGALEIKWDGARPTSDYYPKRLEGAIILGTGGDGSSGGDGTFYEGAITIGNPPSATDDAIQANIVAAGYGR